MTVQLQNIQNIMAFNALRLVFLFLFPPSLAHFVATAQIPKKKRNFNSLLGSLECPKCLDQQPLGSLQRPSTKGRARCSSAAHGCTHRPATRETRTPRGKSEQYCTRGTTTPCNPSCSNLRRCCSASPCYNEARHKNVRRQSPPAVVDSLPIM